MTALTGRKEIYKMWTLNGSTISTPHKKNITNDIQEVLHRKLDGSYSRDFVGSEKKKIDCEWTFISETDYNRIKDAYEDQRDNGGVYTLAISETEYSFSGIILIRISGIDFPLPNHYNYRHLKVTFIEV